MVGQEHLLSILKNNLPNNLILVGDKHSGKKTLVYEIAEYYKYNVIRVNNKIDELRTIGHTSGIDTIFLLADIDTWQDKVLSTLLKPLENNTSKHIILTCRNVSNINLTIQSRCLIFNMDNYTEDEVQNDLCTNIGQTKLVTSELISFVDKVINNIYVATISNALNIEKSININKTDTTGFDFELFFTAIEKRLFQLIKDSSIPTEKRNIYCKIYTVTTKYNAEINTHLLEKRSFLWNFIMDCRLAVTNKVV